MNSDNIFDQLGHAIDLSQVAAVYAYGSQVYGTMTEVSDKDFIVVVDDQTFRHPDRHYTGEFDFSFYKQRQFEALSLEQEISILECLFLPPQHIIADRLKPGYLLDVPKLRASISHKASNSWVKAKKKLEVTKEYHIGIKSLWHSLRVLMFGRQIATKGKIVNYQEANDLFHEIMSSGSVDWTYYKNKYQPIYNQLSTEFKKVAPK